MKLINITTTAYDRLYQEYYLPSLYQNTNMNDIELVEIKYENGGDGIFKDTGYMNTELFKLSVIMDLVKKNTNELIMITDVDIIWLKPFVNHVKDFMSHYDIVWSRQTDPHFPTNLLINSGITIFWANTKLIDFLIKVQDFVQQHNVHNDVAYATEVNNIIDLHFGLLDRRFSTCLFHARNDVPQDTIAYHATNMPGAIGLDNKYDQLNRVKNQFSL